MIQAGGSNLTPERAKELYDKLKPCLLANCKYDSGFTLQWYAPDLKRAGWPHPTFAQFLIGFHITLVGI